MNESLVGKYFVNRARAYSRFEDSGQAVEGRKCVNCIRWRFSSMYACSDAIPMGNRDGSRCLNWADSMDMVRQQEGRNNG